MITLSNAQVLSARNALRELVALPIPIQGALRIRRIIRELTPRLEDIEAERQKLLEFHGEHDENGKLKTNEANQVLFVDTESAQAFVVCYAELMAATWETEYTVRVADLGLTVQVKAETLLALSNLLEE